MIIMCCDYPFKSHLLFFVAWLCRYRPLLTGLTHTEQRLLFTLLTFPQVKVLRDLRANGPGPLVRRMATYSLLTGALSIGLFALSIWYVIAGWHTFLL